MRRAGWLVLLLPLATGCLSAAGLVKELKDDPATVCVSYVGVYGNMQVSRTWLANGKVVCSKDGLTVESVPPKP